MYCKDNPKTTRFVRGEAEAGIEVTNTEWHNVLIGKALQEFEEAMMPKIPHYLRRRSADVGE